MCANVILYKCDLVIISFFERIAFITIAMMQESVMGDGRRLATVASEVEKTLITKQREEDLEEGGGVYLQIYTDLHLAIKLTY